MCSRYELRSPPENIVEKFGLIPSVLDDVGHAIGSEIRPTDPALIIGYDQSADILRWGLEVSWQTQPVINARSETAHHKPTFSPILNNRVVIPASAYFEWRRAGREKIKTRIGTQDTPLLAMAGLRTEDRFTILTCSPSPSIAHIHNRMPVILDASGVDAWLNPDNSFADLAELLHPYAGDIEIEEVPSGKPRQTDLFE